MQKAGVNKYEEQIKVLKEKVVILNLSAWIWRLQE
jgi:hypothetical protein